MVAERKCDVGRHLGELVCPDLAPVEAETVGAVVDAVCVELRHPARPQCSCKTGVRCSAGT